MELIDKEQLIIDLQSEYLDIEEFKYNLICKYSDENGEIYEDDVNQLLDEFLQGIINVIDTAEIIEKRYENG